MTIASASTCETHAGTRSQDLTYSYFGADQKPRVVERITFGQQHYGDAGVWEEYRYDALGRRVLLRARQDSTKGNCGPNRAWCGPVNRNSYIERTIWDGDVVLYEIRAPGGDQTSAAQLEADVAYVDTIGAPYGRTIYTNGADLDHPLDVIRVGYSYGYGHLPGYPGPVVVVPHYNWRGHGMMATLPDGSDASGLYQRVGDTTAFLKIDWPALTTDAGLRRPSPGEPVPWFGNVLEQQRDLSQNLYMRNRYYDPATEKFTQEDPLGLAGGLNLYGFAKGDPVNFSDPFGLCTPIPWCWAQESAEYWAGVAVSSRGLGSAGANLMGGLATLASDPQHAALTGLTLASAGLASAVVRNPALIGVGAAAAPAVGAGTQRLIEALENAGPAMEARIEAVAGWLPQGQRALMTTLEGGGKMLSGGAGERARQIILNPDGTTIIKAFNVGREAFETIKVITPQ